jgi:catechol 2,3-dioxygenase-like lactoylglutathione lyase family enzyme
MDVLHPRLLVTRFADCFRFYDAVLPPLTGATLARGDVGGPYASWDVGTEGVLVLFDRDAMAAAVGTPLGTGGAVLVSRVSDVDAAHALALTHGATDVAPPKDRPEWGPSMRTAHVADPEGNLLEFQQY